MDHDFAQLEWNDAIAEDCRQLVRLAVREDLDRFHDWTTVSLVPPDAAGKAAVVCREPLVVAGMKAAELALAEMDARIVWSAAVSDGARVDKGTTLATIEGSARSLLTSERIALNLLGRLCGVATLTNRYVEAVAGTKARIYDTRKTTPGWRRLEKYAVRLGGGCNHRTGLFDAVLIKDNHLAFGQEGDPAARFSPAEAVKKARAFLADMATAAPRGGPALERMIVEVEVDTLEQLANVLTAEPDIVLLDNMPPVTLAEAVAMRDRAGSRAELEASGGVNLDTVRGIAQSGVDRISVGRLTHAAVSCDVGLDWL
jgi:nicotinate-nucleotide pyrophosphorylase (carboxylating)